MADTKRLTLAEWEAMSRDERVEAIDRGGAGVVPLERLERFVVNLDDLETRAE